jgi:glycerol-3-phosphate dehydrogenase
MTKIWPLLTILRVWIILALRKSATWPTYPGGVDMDIRLVNLRLRRAFGGRVRAEERDGCVFVSGELADWGDVVRACQMCARPHSRRHVVNDIKFTGGEDAPMRMPAVSDDALEGQRPDVLIIGGGISGASIARELTRWNLGVLLAEKEPDLAMQASGRNDGEVHPGIDLGRGSMKHKYIRRGNAMYTDICRQLDVPFTRPGQYVCFRQGFLRPAAEAYVLKRRFIDGISDSRIISGKKLRELAPALNGDFKFAISNPDSGCVCPYGLTIAYGENAAANGARVSLNTAVTGMETENGRIRSVHTNRGTVYPGIVINAAGVFAEEIARMAGDRFYSIHPRRGTNSILDKKAGAYFHAIASAKLVQSRKTHSKGGGILHTVDDNLLVGPDAVETFEKENYATDAESIERVFKKQRITMPELKKSDVITYFTGVRAATFEEDFIIERGRAVENLIHVAGIQSPGLTTAPAVAQDTAKLAVSMLEETGPVLKNPHFNPVRHGIPALRKMDDGERSRMIRENPDYGVIVCRCEEISRGEILDALRAPISVPTLDGVKKRVRPGMGRCQGGFCSPLVTDIIAEFLGESPEKVKKSTDGSNITFGPTKGGDGR